MFDLKRTHTDSTLKRSLAAGTVISQEGVLVCAVIEDGVEKAALVASPAGSEKVIGFTKTADSQPSRTSNVEEVKVPATGALVAQLSKTNLVASRVRAINSATGVALTVITTGTPASGEVLVVLATGALTFHADQAGIKAKFTYLYDLTINQSKQMFGERHINNRDLHSEFGEIELGSGYGELYTDQFDASADWSTAGAIKLGANGILTKSGSGPTLNLVVVSVPSAEHPLLGVRGTLG
jgi:hypothetical protein